LIFGIEWSAPTKDFGEQTVEESYQHLVLVLLLLAAWLLAWTPLKHRALQLDEGNLVNYEINGHVTMELLVLCGPIEKILICCFWPLAPQYGLPPPHLTFLLSGMLPVDCANPAASNACWTQL